MADFPLAKRRLGRTEFAVTPLGMLDWYEYPF